MPFDAPNHLGPFLRKLESIQPLTSEERKLVLALPMDKRELGAGQHLVREGDRPSQCCLLLDGFAQRYSVLPDGRRQIMSFYIPGDLPDLLSLHLNVTSSGLDTLEASRVGFIPHDALRRLMREQPRLTHVFWRDTLIDAEIFQEWMVSMGRRSALSRVAHLVCEMVTRMEAVGLAPGKSIAIPLTQGVIADAVGLSSVRVNRMVQKLRGMELLAWRGKNLTVKDWNRLQDVAEFDPTYLHLADGDVTSPAQRHRGTRGTALHPRRVAPVLAKSGGPSERLGGLGEAAATIGVPRR